MFKKYNEVKIGQRFIHQNTLFTKVIGKWVKPDRSNCILFMRCYKATVFVTSDTRRDWRILFKYLLHCVWLQIKLAYETEIDYV